MVVLFLAIACESAANAPKLIPPETPAPPAAAVASLAPPGAGPQAAPPSAGAVPDAGILYVLDLANGIYRYDGVTGRLDLVWRDSTFDRAAPEGTYVIGRHGGLTLLRWDGTTADVSCGTGYGGVAANGACVSSGIDGVFVRLPGEPSPRLVLPPDWGAGAVAWSPQGDRLLLTRAVRPRPGPGLDPGQTALWVLENDGRLRELYRPAPQGVLTRLRWSPDGRSAIVWQVETTSNSFAADGVGISALLVDVDRSSVTNLGMVFSTQPQWSPDGALAYIRGGGRFTWDNKELVVRKRDGTERVARAPTDEPRVALAPAWDPARGRLAWVSGPRLPGSGNGDGYIDGVGAGKRVGVIEDGTRSFEVSCPDGRVVEGVRWSSDGNALLLLCRKVGTDPRPLELWLHRLGDGTADRLVTGLPGDSVAAGFGFYGLQPSLFSIVTWSRAVP